MDRARKLDELHPNQMLTRVMRCGVFAAWPPGYDGDSVFKRAARSTASTAGEDTPGGHAPASSQTPSLCRRRLRLRLDHVHRPPRVVFRRSGVVEKLLTFLLVSKIDA